MRSLRVYSKLPIHRSTHPSQARPIRMVDGRHGGSVEWAA